MGAGVPGRLIALTALTPCINHSPSNLTSVISISRASII